MVEAGHVVQRPLDPLLDLLDPGDAGLGLGVEAVLPRVEPRLEQLPQQPRDVGVAAQRRLDVVDGEGRVALLHVLRVRAQHGRLPPGQPGGEDEGVEPVDLVVAVPDRADGVLEQAAHLVGQPGGVLEAELVDERRPVEPVELVRPLVEDLDAHRGQHRQHLRQRQPRADAEHLEARLAATGVERREQRDVDAGVGLDGLQPAHVQRGRGRGEVLLVGLGERVGVPAGEPRAAVLAVLGHGRVDEVVAPGAGRVGEHPLEVAGVDVGDLGPERRVHDEVHAGGRRLAHLDVELDVLAVEAVEQDLREPLADGRVVAVAGQVAEHGDVAAVGLAADEDAQLAAADGLQHALGDLGQLLGRACGRSRRAGTSRGCPSGSCPRGCAARRRSAPARRRPSRAAAGCG